MTMSVLFGRFGNFESVAVASVLAMAERDDGGRRQHFAKVEYSDDSFWISLYKFLSDTRGRERGVKPFAIFDVKD